MDRGKLIFALRCSASVHPMDEELMCETCPYWYEEKIPETLKAMADLEKDGEYFVNGCDVDKMAMDAADMIEADGKDR